MTAKETAKLVAELMRAEPDGPTAKSVEAARYFDEKMRAERAQLDAFMEAAKASGLELSESEARLALARMAAEAGGDQMRRLVDGVITQPLLIVVLEAAEKEPDHISSHRRILSYSSTAVPFMLDPGRELSCGLGCD